MVWPCFCTVCGLILPNHVAAQTWDQAPSVPPCVFLFVASCIMSRLHKWLIGNRWSLPCLQAVWWRLKDINLNLMFRLSAKWISVLALLTLIWLFVQGLFIRHSTCRCSDSDCFQIQLFLCFSPVSLLFFSCHSMFMNWSWTVWTGSIFFAQFEIFETRVHWLDQMDSHRFNPHASFYWLAFVAPVNFFI